MTMHWQLVRKAFGAYVRKDYLMLRGQVAE